ncbi:FtsW/RodA/SpoVE family cell cycle protein, partial [Streptomyces anulatus]
IVLLPVAGMPLPFGASGGSSMVAVWVALGLLQSIRVQRPLSA